MTAADPPREGGYAFYMRSCAKKKRFRTEYLAERHGAKWGQRPYECPCCGFWHLASTEDQDWIGTPEVDNTGGA